MGWKKARGSRKRGKGQTRKGNRKGAKKTKKRGRKNLALSQTDQKQRQG